MGAKTWMLVFSKSDAAEALKSNPELNHEATHQLAKGLFPKNRLEAIGEGDLSDTCPDGDEIYAGCFPDVSIVAAKEFGIDYPSKLPASFISAGGSGTIHLHAMHSVVDWIAFAKWSNGQLMRSLSVSPDNGIQEDIGTRFPFEEPYWSGKHPVDVEDDEPYPLPFHPLELGEAALKAFFGYQLEGSNDPELLDTESIPLIKYKRTRSRWKFW